jgi:hypothetical protein
MSAEPTPLAIVATAREDAEAIHSNLRLYRRHGYIETRRQPVSPAVSLVYLRKSAGARTLP